MDQLEEMLGIPPTACPPGLWGAAASEDKPEEKKCQAAEREEAAPVEEPCAGMVICECHFRKCLSISLACSIKIMIGILTICSM